MNRMFEEFAMNAWPALSTHQFDGWLLKYANGYTKRANSVYPIYDSSIDFLAKIDYVEKYYKGLSLDATFKMNDSDSLRLLDRLLEDKGYHVLDPTDVMVRRIEANENEACDKDYIVAEGFNYEWMYAYIDLGNLNDNSDKSKEAIHTLEAMLKLIKEKTFYVRYEDEGVVVAIGQGVVEREHLGIFNILVKEDYRGNGYGKKLMNAIEVEGTKYGAKESYLQVVCKNQVACNLYKSLGYEKLYTYWYRRKGDVK